MTHINPNFEQLHFRGRDDDVTLNSATFTYLLDANWTQKTDQDFRVRFEIEEDAGASTAEAPGGQLEASHNGGAFFNVTTSSTIVRAVLSPNFAEGDPTTDVLAGSGLGFVAGTGSEDGIASPGTLSNQHTEVEYSLRIIGTNVANNDTIVLRVQGLHVYTVSPSITVNKVSFTLSLAGFRARNDDGSEATATWKEVENVGWTQPVDENFRLRCVVDETGGGASSDVSFQLQANRNGVGFGSLLSASTPVVRVFDSPNEADGTPTTRQLTSGVGDFLANAFDDVDGISGTTSFTGGELTEIEFCLQVLSVDVANNDTIEFRVVRGGAFVVPSAVIPTLTVSKTAGVTVTKVVDTNAVLEAVKTLSVAGSAVLKQSKVEIVTGSSAVLQSTEAVLVTGAAVLQKTATLSVGSTAVLKKSGVPLSTGGTAVLQSTETLSTGTSVVLRSTEVRSTNSDALLFAAGSVSTNVTAVLEKVAVRTVGVDAILRSTKTLGVGATAVLQSSKVLPVIGDTVLKGAITKAVTVDAVLESGVETFTLLVNTSAVLQGTEARTVGTDAQLLSAGAVVVGVTVVLQGTESKLVTTDGVLRKTRVVEVGVDGQLLAETTVSVGGTAVLRRLNIQLVTESSSILQSTEALSASVSGQLILVPTLQVSVTAVRKKIGAIRTVGVSAYILGDDPAFLPGFYVAFDKVNPGVRLSGSEKRLHPHPTRVEYPTDPAGSVLDTSDGRAIQQQPVVDNRRRVWVWVGYRQDMPVYSQLWDVLESLRARYRLEQGGSPYIWVKDSITKELRRQDVFTGTASSATTTALEDSTQSWPAVRLIGYEIEIISGTGAGQVREVVGNTTTEVTVDLAWGVVPDSTSHYAIRGWIDDWFRVRAVEISRKAEGVGRYAETQLVFVIEDSAFNWLG